MRQCRSPGCRVFTPAAGAVGSTASFRANAVDASPWQLEFYILALIKLTCQAEAIRSG